MTLETILALAGAAVVFGGLIYSFGYRLGKIDQKLSRLDSALEEVEELRRALLVWALRTLE